MNKELYDKEVELPEDKRIHLRKCFQKVKNADANSEGYKRNKKSKYKNDPNFISRQILPEIQKQKAIKMLEDMLAKKKSSSDADITEKEKEIKVSNILKKNLKSIKKQMDKEGLSKKDILKLLDGE